MDAPEPDWKYLSGFAVKKGRPEPAGRGISNDLIAPRRGPITTAQHSPTTPNLDTHADPQEEPAIPGANGTTDNLQGDPPTENQPAPLLPGLQTAQDVPPALQTRSGRIIRNTLRYDQSINQRNQGLVAWEVLLDKTIGRIYQRLNHSTRSKSRWKTPWLLRQRLTRTYCTGTKL